MITAAEKRIIKDGFERLRILDNQTQTSYRRNLFNANRREERQHRSGWCNGRGYPKSATVSIAAQYFTVKDILAALDRDYKLWTVKDSLHIKETAIQAQALAENYAEILTEQFGGFDRDGFKSLDYSKMVKTDGLMQ
tara:strand:+ start:759 stop:1169 length:411 start_codon:yes stop_codon:yes gene_type:complete